MDQEIVEPVPTCALRQFKKLQARSVVVVLGEHVLPILSFRANVTGERRAGARTLKPGWVICLFLFGFQESLFLQQLLDLVWSVHGESNSRSLRAEVCKKDAISFRSVIVLWKPSAEVSGTMDPPLPRLQGARLGPNSLDFIHSDTFTPMSREDVVIEENDVVRPYLKEVIGVESISLLH